MSLPAGYIAHLRKVAGSHFSLVFPIHERTEISSVTTGLSRVCHGYNCPDIFINHTAFGCTIFKPDKKDYLYQYAPYCISYPLQDSVIIKEAEINLSSCFLLTYYCSTGRKKSYPGSDFRLSFDAVGSSQCHHLFSHTNTSTVFPSSRASLIALAKPFSQSSKSEQRIFTSGNYDVGISHHSNRPHNKD